MDERDTLLGMGQIEHEHELYPYPHRHAIVIIVIIIIIIMAPSCHCRPAKRIMCISVLAMFASIRLLCALALTKIKHRHKQTPNAQRPTLHVNGSPQRTCGWCERAILSHIEMAATQPNEIKRKEENGRKKKRKNLEYEKCSSIIAAHVLSCEWVGWNNPMNEDRRYRIRALPSHIGMY